MRLRALFLCLGIAEALQAQQVSPLELALGKRLAEEMKRTETVLGSAAAQEYVERTGDRIAQAMWDGSFPYTFAVIRGHAPEVADEPVALPGGYVLVRSELFLAAHDGSEFAAMLAHSMAHTVLRHGRNQPNVFMGGAVPRGYLAHQRENELEADRWAVQALERAGLDRGALARYLDRVLTAGPEKERRLKDLPHGAAAVADADFTAVRAEVSRAIEEVAPKRTAPSLLNGKGAERIR